MSQPVQGEPDYPSIKDEAVDVERERCARIAEMMGRPDIADEIRKGAD